MTHPRNLAFLAVATAALAVPGLQAQTTAPRYAVLDYHNTFTSGDGITVRGNGPDLETGQPFGGTTTVSLGVGAGTRMQFIPGYSVFRAGTVDGTQWDQANLGVFSTAFGYNTTASGTFSFAAGVETVAEGDLAFALGYDAKASGAVSFAQGYQTVASGDGAVAFGSNTVAAGASSLASGVYSNAGGFGATALGYRTTASGHGATALGNSSQATGLGATAAGIQTIASGRSAAAFGHGTVARSFGETAAGTYNVDVTPSSATAWNAADRLFVVGNGQSASARSDAFVVFKNGNATIRGTLTQGSDRSRKTDILLSDTKAILTLVGELPIYTWKYQGEDATHLGPMSQDFFAAFALGATDTGIASVDADGVALAAIQELKKQSDAKDARLASLEARLAELERQVVALVTAQSAK